jgi:transcriptional regulator with PAS, ATPase and Fis domain
VILLDYQKMEMDLICGILDALPQPTVLLNRNGQAAYVNQPGEELELWDYDYGGSESVLAALTDGVRQNGEQLKIMDTPGVVRIYPVYQGEEIAGALFCFSPITTEAGDNPSQLPYASVAIQEVNARIARLSGVNAAVLFVGETGVGKESFARVLHSQSLRSDRPFRPIDCRPGAGTLFFDGLDTLNPEGQETVLNIIRHKKLGDYDITARLCFSATPEIKTLAETGRYIYELFSRVSLMSIFIPPLRDRSDDIPPLARYYLDK